VSLGADFLGTWISPVEYTAGWRAGRISTVARPRMSHQVQLEGRMSLTGSKADQRIRVAPDEYAAVLHGLYWLLEALAGAAVEGAAGSRAIEGPLDAQRLRQLAGRLWDARGARCLR